MKDEIFKYLKNKGKILILGFGREGKSTYNLIREMDSSLPIGIADLKEITDEEVKGDNNVTFYIGDNYLDACELYDVVIKGPGVIIKDLDLKKPIFKKTACGGHFGRNDVEFKWEVPKVLDVEL